MLKLHVLGKFDDVQVLHIDAEGGFVADILRDDTIIRCWYTPGHWTPGTWTTAPEYVEETVRTMVLA